MQTPAAAFFSPKSKSVERCATGINERQYGILWMSASLEAHSSKENVAARAVVDAAKSLKLFANHFTLVIVSDGNLARRKAGDSLIFVYRLISD